MGGEEQPESVGRRRLLRAGLFGAGGLGVVVATQGQASAHQQSLQVIDVKVHGAVGNGIADDTAAIQSALNEVTSKSKTPNVVYFPAGDYRVSAPLRPRSNTMMAGTHTVDNVSDLDPISQCRIAPLDSFVGSGVIELPDKTAPAGQTVGLTIRNLMLGGRGIGGSLNAGQGVAGIRLPDAVNVETEHGLTLEDVSITGFSGAGIRGSLIAASFINCHVARNQGWGVDVSGANRWTDVHVMGCFFYFNRLGNLRFGGTLTSGQLEFVNCRIERAGGNPNLPHVPDNPTAPGVRISNAMMVRFANCTTDANMGNGFEIVRDVNVPGTDYLPHHIQLVNCTFSRDGTGNQQVLSDFAGLKVAGIGPSSGAVGQVTCVNCVVAGGFASDTGGSTVYGPKFGVWIEHTNAFAWIGGDVADDVANAHHSPVAGSNDRSTLINLRRGLLTLPTVAPWGIDEVPNGAVYVENNNLKVRIGGAWRTIATT